MPLCVFLEGSGVRRANKRPDNKTGGTNGNENQKGDGDPQFGKGEGEGPPAVAGKNQTSIHEPFGRPSEKCAGKPFWVQSFNALDLALPARLSNTGGEGSSAVAGENQQRHSYPRVRRWGRKGSSAVAGKHASSSSGVGGSSAVAGKPACDSPASHKGDAGYTFIEQEETFSFYV